MYGYGKHGEVGDCNVPSPAFYNIVAKKKWEAWNKMKGTDVNESKVKFLKMAKELLAKDQNKLWEIVIYQFLLNIKS